jgi:hypothetical protein
LSVVALLAVGCGDDQASDEPAEPEATAGVATGSVPQVRLSGLRTVEVPDADALTAGTDEDQHPQQHLAALGTDEVLVASIEAYRPGRFFVGSMVDDEWIEIDPPPIEGRLDPWFGTVGQDVVVVGATCPSEEFYPDADVDEVCPGGYDALGMWRLDHVRHEWTEVAFLPPSDLGTEETDPNLCAIPVGVSRDAVAVHLCSGLETVLLIHSDGTADTPYEGNGQPGSDVFGRPLCITASGVLAGLAGGDGLNGGGMSGDAVHATSVGLNHFAFLHPGDAEWTVVDDVTYTGVQSVACGADQVSIVGETDTTLSTADWRVFDEQGRLLSTTRLPDDAVLGPEADFTTASFWTDHQYFPAQGRNHQTVVRDFGNLEQLDRVDAGGDPSAGYPVLLPRRIVVLPRPGAPSLTQTYPDDQEVFVEGTAALPDGRVVVLVSTRTSFDEADVELHLLVAE